MPGGRSIGSERSGPLAWFWYAGAAAVLQISAVVLRTHIVCTTKKYWKSDLKLVELVG